MKALLWVSLLGLLAGPLPGLTGDAQPGGWKDPSPHKVRFVTVDHDVKLEVLDWGGKGRPVMLLAGIGNTAHVFDEFAPRLVKEHHVYAVTRRGFGASSTPQSGYGADRMGDDVVAVLDALKIRRPVLIGHSWGGSDVSSVASRYPRRIAGGIYLDCDRYAYAIDQNGMLEDGPKDLKAMVASNAAPSPPLVMPTEADLRDWSSAIAWYRRTYEARRTDKVPEAEWRQIIATTPDGRPTFAYRVDSRISAAIDQGEQRYERIPVPALLILRSPPPLKDGQSDERARDDWETSQARAEGRAAAFRRVAPGSRVVLLPGAEHYVFLSNPEDVLREIRTFTASLR